MGQDASGQIYYGVNQTDEYQDEWEEIADLLEGDDNSKKKDEMVSFLLERHVDFVAFGEEGGAWWHALVIQPSLIDLDTADAVALDLDEMTKSPLTEWDKALSECLEHLELTDMSTKYGWYAACSYTS